jgi:hypothetical protein
MNRLAISFLVLCCVGCVEKAAVTPFPEQVIPATITTSDDELLPGETATITVTLTNTIDEVVQLTFPTQCQALVFIRNSNGRVMTPENGTWECASVPSSVTIDVGKTKTYNLEWGGGIEFGPAGTSPRVPPGSYLASGELRADGYHAIAFPITIVVR